MEKLVILLFIVLTSQEFLIQSNLTKRYKNINFPHTKGYYVPPAIFKDELLYTPKIWDKSNKGTIDLCTDVKKKAQILLPHIWNNTNIKNPCSTYFCPSNKNFLQGIEQSPAVLSEVLNTNSSMHAFLYQYCLKCEETFDQRFDLEILNGSCYVTNTSLAKLCDQGCDSSWECLYISPISKMCYSKDKDLFLGDSDSLHQVFVFIRLYIIPYCYLIPNIIIFFVKLFLIILPELFFLYRVYHKNLRFSNMFIITFSLKNQCIIWSSIVNVLYIITGIMDISNMIVQNFTGYVLYFHFASVLYSWGLLIILWAHIYNQTSSVDSSLSTALKILWCVLTFGGLGICIFAAIFVVLILVVVDTTANFAISIVSMVFIIFLAFCLLIVGIVLVIAAMKLFFILEKPKDLKDLSFYLFKLKLTRNLIFFVAILFPTLFFTITAGITFVWDDIFTFYFLQFQSYVNCFISLLFSILTTITLIHNENLYNFYCYFKK